MTMHNPYKALFRMVEKVPEESKGSNNEIDDIQTLVKLMQSNY